LSAWAATSEPLLWARRVSSYGRTGEEDLRERRRRVASLREDGRHGRTHARQHSLHGGYDPVCRAEREPAAKRLGHHVRQPIAGDDAGDVGIERVGKLAGKGSGAERRRADSFAFSSSVRRVVS
jgi:hypothetical protein